MMVESRQCFNFKIICAAKPTTIVITMEAFQNGISVPDAHVSRIQNGDSPLEKFLVKSEDDPCATWIMYRTAKTCKI